MRVYVQFAAIKHLGVYFCPVRLAISGEMGRVVHQICTSMQSHAFVALFCNSIFSKEPVVTWETYWNVTVIPPCLPLIMDRVP